ncbi:Uncharacterised protein [Vibrio cholerae]|nr:Uncharacterised protein [Vibrio cholerae]
MNYPLVRKAKFCAHCKTMKFNLLAKIEYKPSMCGF